jgi:putative NADH-flavin reductase
MKLTVFGATGGTGQALVAQALQQGHEVVAFMRDPGKFTITDTRLSVVQGDITENASRVGEAIRGQDAVISALGRRNSFRSAGLISQSMRTIVSAMERQGVRRLIVLSAFGVGESYHYAPLIPRIMFRLLLGDIFADKKAGEDYVRQSSLDWTLVYPVLLTNGPRTGKYRVGERLDLHGVPKVSRADVADFILTQLQDAGYRHRTALISY